MCVVTVLWVLSRLANQQIDRSALRSTPRRWRIWRATSCWWRRVRCTTRRIWCTPSWRTSSATYPISFYAYAYRSFNHRDTAAVLPLLAVAIARPLLGLILSAYRVPFRIFLDFLRLRTSYYRLWSWFNTVDTDRSGAITATELGSSCELGFLDGQLSDVYLEFRKSSHQWRLDS